MQQLKMNISQLVTGDASITSLFSTDMDKRFQNVELGDLTAAEEQIEAEYGDHYKQLLSGATRCNFQQL